MVVAATGTARAVERACANSWHMNGFEIDSNLSKTGRMSSFIGG